MNGVGDSPDGVDAWRGNGFDDEIDDSAACSVVALNVEDALAHVISRTSATATARVRDAHALHTAGCRGMGGEGQVAIRR